MQESLYALLSKRMGKRKNKKRNRVIAGSQAEDLKKEDLSVADTNNPLLAELQSFLKKLSREEKDSFFSNSLDPQRRAELWMEQADIGEKLVNQYAWAVPDERAIRILKHFGPIVEIGAGCNAYWCRQMKQAGIDVIGYDVDSEKGGRISGTSKKHRDVFHVLQGGPEVLEEHSDRTLFLCYPDEDDTIVTEPEEGPISMGAACLKYYKGDYVIHVGELYGSTLSMEQAPWGRSSSPEFQQQLAADFHCLLQISLPSWLHVRDTLSVWKRSETCAIVFAADEEDEDGDEEVEYRHIAAEERLPMDRVAPCLEHLLKFSSNQGPPSSKEAYKRPASAMEIEIKSSGKKQKKENQSETIEGYKCPW